MVVQPPAPQPGQALPAPTRSAPFAGAGDATRPPVLRSEDMLRGQRAVDILHAGVRYRLSLTALGKLILTK